MSEINSRNERRNFLRTGIISFDPSTVLERLATLETNASPVVDKAQLIIAQAAASLLVESEYTVLTWDVLVLALAMPEDTQPNVDDKTLAINYAIVNLGTNVNLSPMAQFTVVIPEEGDSLSSYCDDSSYFPDYNEEDDFAEYLQSLGTFEVDWGDGTIDTFSYEEDGYNGDGFTHEYAAGTYTITWKSNRVSLSSEYIENGVLYQNLQYLYLQNCTGLTSPPDLTGSTSLQYLSLQSCTGLTSPPDLTGLTSLKYLDLQSCTGLTSPPDLTGLTSLKYLDLYNCTGLTSPPVLTGLTSLQYLYLQNCTGLTSPPDLTGLTSLQHLDLYNCTGLTSPPDLTGLTSLKYLYLQNCTGFDVAGIDSILTYFAVLYQYCAHVSLIQNPARIPTSAIKLAAQQANPQCTFQTN